MQSMSGNLCLLGGPTRRRPVLSSPAPPRRSAVRRPALDMFGFWVRQLGLNGNSLFLFPMKRPEQIFTMPWRPWKANGMAISYANRFVGVPPCPARSAPPPRAAPPRPARHIHFTCTCLSGFWIQQIHHLPVRRTPGCPGFGFDKYTTCARLVLLSNRYRFLQYISHVMSFVTLPEKCPAHFLTIPWNAKKMSNQKPGHTTGGSVRRGARRSGGTGRDWTQHDADGSVRPGDKRPSYLPRHRTQSSETRSSEILCKPMGQRKPRLTSSLFVGRRPLFVPSC